MVLRGTALGPLPLEVAVKVYERPALTPKKQKMATREAIVLKYLNSQGCVRECADGQAGGRRRAQQHLQLQRLLAGVRSKPGPSFAAGPLHCHTCIHPASQPAGGPCSSTHDTPP